MATGDLNSMDGGLTARLKAERLNLLLAFVGFLPLLTIFFLLSWKRPEYQFFPLALVGASMLAWRATTEIPSLTSGLPSIARWMVIPAVLLALAANIVWSPWLGFVDFVLFLAIALLGMGGVTLLKSFLPALVMLLTILPPPLKWDELLTLKLRSLAVHISSILMDWLGVIHAQDGNTLQLPGKQLLVAEACSGINSFVLCNAFCVFWLLWRRRSLWWLCFALPTTSLFVVLGNILRITVGATAFSRWKWDLLEGWTHETFGVLLLLGYCILIISLDQFLVFVTQQSDYSHPADKQPVVSTVGYQTSPRSGSAIGFKFVGGILAVAGFGMLITHLAFDRNRVLATLPLYSTTELKLSLPDQLAGWTRMTGNSGNASMAQTIAVNSISWRFERAGSYAIISADYPLPGFHNVRVCYEGNGWHTVSEGELMDSTSHADLHAIRLGLEQFYRRAVVFHSVINNRGEWLSLPKSESTAAIPPAGYRIQLITGGYTPLSGADEAAAEALFFKAREILVEQLLNQLQKAGAR